MTYQLQIKRLFVYTTTRKGFLILKLSWFFIFKFSWNTACLRQSINLKFWLSISSPECLIWTEHVTSIYIVIGQCAPLGQSINSNSVQVGSLNFSQQKGWNYNILLSQIMIWSGWICIRTSFVPGSVLFGMDMIKGTGSRLSACSLTKVLFLNLLSILLVNNPTHMYLSDLRVYFKVEVYFRGTWSRMKEY